MAGEKKPAKASHSVQMEEVQSTPIVPEGTYQQTPSVDGVLFKRIFFGSLALMLLVFWCSGYNIGFCSDEMDMNLYGKVNYSYYFSGGRDTSFLNLHQEGDTANAMKTLPYYGSSFEYVATGINYLTGQLNTRNEYNVRHMLNQLFAVLAILFTGLCAKRISGYRAAVIASWLLFLTPTFFGWALFDTKDIPFCAGYIASVYCMLHFFDEFPSPGWRSVFFLTAALSFTIGTRVGGLLLFLYLFAFVFLFLWTGPKSIRENFKIKTLIPIFQKIIVLVAFTLAVVILMWPYVLRAPLTNLLEAINSAKKFPANIAMNFNGEPISSIALPGNYLFTYLAITIPILILVLVPASVLLLIAARKRINWKAALLVLVASIFPLIYAVVTGVNLYNGWRHMLFMYPGFIVIGALGIDYLMARMKKTTYQVGLAVACLACLAHPIAWSAKNNPYQYMYYNELEGFSKGYTDYENDVWSISVRPAIDWLMTNPDIASSRDTIILGSNTPQFSRLYLKTNYPGSKVRVVFAGAKDYHVFHLDYLILNTIFLTTDFLQNNYPPDGTIHTINAGGQPITAIVRDTLHLQSACVAAIMKNDFQRADSIGARYLTSVRKINPYMYGPLAIAKARSLKFAEAIDYGKKAVAINEGDVFGHSALCFAYFMQHNLEAAVSEINECLTYAPNDGFIRQLADSIVAKVPQ